MPIARQRVSGRQPVGGGGVGGGDGLSNSGTCTTHMPLQAPLRSTSNIITGIFTDIVVCMK